MLKYIIVNPILLKCLRTLMDCAIFDKFRLVGGTSLSLQLGNRVSVDIDLFTDSEYGTFFIGTCQVTPQPVRLGILTAPHRLK
jgi:hypothetical protein